MSFPHRFALHQRVMKHCSVFGHGFVPSTDIRVVHEGGGYRLQTNSAGYRCIERSARPAPKQVRVQGAGPLRVAVFGDSFTAGDGVDNAQRWTDRLQSTWGVDLHNFAVSGTGPDQNLLLAESLDLDAFDLVLWATATHTIGRIQMADRLTLNRQGKIRRVARPHFVLKNGQLELVPMPAEAPRATDNELDPVPLSLDSRWRTSIISPVQAWGRRAVGTFRRTIKPRSDDDYKDASSEGWQLFSAIAERMVRAAGTAPLVIVPLPTRAHLRGELGPAYRVRFRDLGRRLLGKSGADRDAVRIIDVLEPVLEEGKRTGAKLAFDFDGHYTPEGHLALANVIAENLAANAANHLEGTVPRLPLTRAEPSSTAASSIEARWSLEDSICRVLPSDALAKPISQLPWQSEASFSGGLGVLGTLPWSAIAASLSSAYCFGSSVTSTRLESPVDATDLANHDGPFHEWVEVAAPWIRWRGAAEIDLRQIFGVRTRVEHVVVVDPGLWEQAKGRAAESTGEDAEAIWLRRRLLRIHNLQDRSKRVTRLESLATTWERATRRARYSALPLPPPEGVGAQIQFAEQVPLR